MAHFTHVVWHGIHMMSNPYLRCIAIARGKVHGVQRELLQQPIQLHGGDLHLGRDHDAERRLAAERSQPDVHVEHGDGTDAVLPGRRQHSERESILLTEPADEHIGDGRRVAGEWKHGVRDTVLAHRWIVAIEQLHVRCGQPVAMTSTTVSGGTGNFAWNTGTSVTQY